MRVEELKLGQRVRIKDLEMGGGTHFAKVDSFTPDMFNGFKLWCEIPDNVSEYYKVKE